MKEHGQNVPRDLASWERKIKDIAKPQPVYTPDRVRPLNAIKYRSPILL